MPADRKPIDVEKFISAMYAVNWLAPTRGHETSMNTANSETDMIAWKNGSHSASV